MVKPRRNFFIEFIFARYINYIIWRNFKGVKYNSVGFDSGSSILLLANHFSWWDGFLLYHLNQKLFKKKFHIMVLAETVERVFFMKHLGAFSLRKDSREMLTTLNYAAELLNDPNNMVVIFPQGKLHSNFTYRINFKKGVERIVAKTTGNFQYVFAATFIENLATKRPTVNIYLEQANGAVMHTDALNELYMRHYSASKLKQTQVMV